MGREERQVGEEAGSGGEAAIFVDFNVGKSILNGDKGYAYDCRREDRNHFLDGCAPVRLNGHRMRLHKNDQ